MARKRERIEIIKDMLDAVNSHKKIRPTRLLYACNLSPQMFKEYLSELKTKGFLEEVPDKKSKRLAITDKGTEFLIKYKELSGFIRNFGL